MSLNQAQAAIYVIKQYYGKDFDATGMTHTDEAKDKMTDMLIELYNKKEIAIKNDQKNVRVYLKSMLNNTILKHPELNGGKKYVAEREGTRAGQGDDSVKAMRALLKTLVEGTASYIKVSTALNNRIAELKASKVKHVEIDISALPAELRDLVG